MTGNRLQTHVCNPHFKAYLTIYQTFEDLSCSLFFAHPLPLRLIFCPIQMCFTHPNDGWRGFYIKQGQGRIYCWCMGINGDEWLWCDTACSDGDRRWRCKGRRQTRSVSLSFCWVWARAMMSAAASCSRNFCALSCDVRHTAVLRCSCWRRESNIACCRAITFLHSTTWGG